MQIDMTDEERDILIRWKKRSDTYRLVRMKAEAILYAARGVGLDIIAEMVERAEGTVREWLSEWRQTRLGSVVTGHAGNENAAKLKRAQKKELEEILSRPPSEAGVKAGFWDVPALKDVVSIKFGVEYRSESSYRLLMRFLGMTFKLPDPFDKRRDEKAIARRMAEIRRQVNDLLEEGWEVYTVDEVRVDQVNDLLEEGWEAWCRRGGPRPPRGRDEAHVASQGKENKAVRGPQEGEPVVLRGTEPDDQENEDLPHRGKPERRADHPHDGSPGARDR